MIQPNGLKGFTPMEFCFFVRPFYCLKYTIFHAQKPFSAKYIPSAYENCYSSGTRRFAFHNVIRSTVVHFVVGIDINANQILKWKSMLV